LVEAMSDRYPNVDVSFYRKKYILYYKSHKNNIKDHRRNFEVWLMQESQKETENEWIIDEEYYQ
tara:strand:+ start:176 stop:367 length:192 start_codon:yes stop_codon:yes gene_type:complete